MNKNHEEDVNSYIEESFIRKKQKYQNIIEGHIKDGLAYKDSSKKIEADIYKKLNNVKFKPVYKDLIDLLENIIENYGYDKFNKAIRSKEFQDEVKKQNKTLNEFISIHKEYQAEFEVLKFHHQNRDIFKKYFIIKYNPKLKYKIDYYDLNLYPGGRENDSLVNKEVERLHLILYPPSKSKDYKLKKYGIDLTTKDIAVFMVLFKGYYKIKLSTYVEFVALSRLIFDDLHYNYNAGNSKLGLSIERYLNGKELFNSKFTFDSSKAKVVDILSEINLKEFKKYVERIENNKFKRLLS